MRKMRFMSVMYCHTLVSPGTGATLQTFLVRRVLITELLPTEEEEEGRRERKGVRKMHRCVANGTLIDQAGLLLTLLPRTTQYGC